MDSREDKYRQVGCEFLPELASGPLAVSLKRLWLLVPEECPRFQLQFLCSHAHLQQRQWLQ